MRALATPADDTYRPDPPPDRTAASTPSRTGRLLSVVRRLIAFAASLATTLQSAAANDVSRLTRPFGTKDIALILARIRRGLLLARTLEGRLIVHPVPEKTQQPPAPAANASTPARKPRTTQPQPRRVWIPDPRLAPLPTIEQIEAEIRRRPIGAVLSDICRDFGITPAHPLWGEVSGLITEYGGTIAHAFTALCRQLRQGFIDRHPAVARELWPTLFPPAIAACSTGPP
jgi:hypothetical protein